MSNADEMGLGEFHDFEREVLDRLIKIETKLDSVESMKKTSYDNQRDIIALKKDTDEQEKRIRAIEDSNTWLWRTAVGAVITTLISILYQFISISGR